MRTSADPAFVRGGGPVGLVAALALARRGRVLIELPRSTGETVRVDSLPLPLLAVLIELGVHPSTIKVSATSGTVMSTWESEVPTTREIAPKITVERHLLERALRTQVTRNPRIAIVEDGELEVLPEVRVDATGRRAASARSILEPASPWIARIVVVSGDFGPAQQSLRLAPFPGGYAYRLASPSTATLGIVEPDPATGLVSGLFDRVRNVGCGWILAGLDEATSRPGRGGKASVQLSVLSPGWIAVGDALFASDALSSQGLANGISSAMKLTGWSRPAQSAAFDRHVGHMLGVIGTNRFNAAPVWNNYARFLSNKCLHRQMQLPDVPSGVHVT